MELSDVTIALRRHWLVAALALAFWLLVGAFLPAVALAMAGGFAIGLFR